MAKKRPTLALFDTWLSEEKVRAGFERSFGRVPEQAKRTGGGWLVGPVTSKELARWKAR